MHRNTKYICFEGPDRSGKATQSEMLEEYFRNTGYEVVRYEVPINDRITHPLIYWMLKNGSAKRFPNLFQTIQFLNKAFFQIFLSFNCTYKYDFVILDRWKLSGEVYGSIEGVNPWLLRTYNWILFDPNVTFVLTGQPWRTSIDGRDVYEKDGLLQEKVRTLYQDIARALESKKQGVFSIEYTVETPSQIQKKIVETLRRAKETFF